MMWDFTCPDSPAASHLNRAVVGPGSVANDAESRKSAKYQTLSPLSCFAPVAVAKLGALGGEASHFFRNIGQRIANATGEPRSYQFLMQQRLSVSVQRGNAALFWGQCLLHTDWTTYFIYRPHSF